MKADLGEIRKRFPHVFDPAFQISFTPVDSAIQMKDSRASQRDGVSYLALEILRWHSR